MHRPEKLRDILRDNLDDTVNRLNQALRGERLSGLEKVLRRVGRGGRLPHWYTPLAETGTLPNLDGKTIGSVLEMLFVGVLEVHTFKGVDTPVLHINPARGVDFPELQLGMKSPSENYCTSEPFFTAYERLIGSEHDAVILLTDYQVAKKKPPLRLQVIKHSYLVNTQIADENLCRIARDHREWLLKESEPRAKKLFRFLAYVNQSDWRAKEILRMLRHLSEPRQILDVLEHAPGHFAKVNSVRDKKGYAPLPDSELQALLSITKVKPLHVGVLEATENWVIDVHKDFGRFPNDNEWNRLKGGPLNGRIGMSFALQWRYNFGRLFKGSLGDVADEEDLSL